MTWNLVKISNIIPYIVHGSVGDIIGYITKFFTHIKTLISQAIALAFQNGLFHVNLQSLNFLIYALKFP